jgi:hypothetical protein
MDFLIFSTRSRVRIPLGRFPDHDGEIDVCIEAKSKNFEISPSKSYLWM